ncbi:MAG TPA: hypothetical protein VLD39_02995 [Gammaproteobacteria bacterium]|nr:hypothetical protein [Gammaproteobacteria bacterium]
MSDHSVPRRARGERPRYFDEPAVDQLHAIVLALAAEISVLQDRFDLLERVLDARGVLRRSDLDSIELTEEAESERRRRRDELVRRIFRVVKEDRDTLESE